MGIIAFFGSGLLLLIAVLWSRFRKKQRRFIYHIINGLAALGCAWVLIITGWGFWNTIKMIVEW